MNDSIKNIFREAFSMSELSIGKMDICDIRNEKIVEEIHNYDVVILAGGHVPTQNAFFHKIVLQTPG